MPFARTDGYFRIYYLRWQADNVRIFRTFPYPVGIRMTYFHSVFAEKDVCPCASGRTVFLRLFCRNPLLRTEKTRNKSPLFSSLLRLCAENSASSRIRLFPLLFVLFVPAREKKEYKKRFVNIYRKGYRVREGSYGKRFV